jgi:methyl-accepting chemotaxis protein
MIIALIVGTYLSSKMAKDVVFVHDGLLNFFDYINHKKDSVELINVKTKDEIGQMARSINLNIKKIEETYKTEKNLINEASQVMEKVNNGYFDVKISSTSTNESLNELKNSVNDMLRVLNSNISKLLKLLETYSRGNYKGSCQIKSNGQFQELINGVNHLGSSIQAMLQSSNNDAIELQDSAQTLEHNVKEITDSAQSQSTAIEQSTQSVAHVSQVIELNHQRSNTMASLASTLHDFAISGDKLAKQTNNSMDEIDVSTSNIVEAIDIINQIAFQTNILSLNAAVEAATAGEAGKGFAVVAGEVRNLASRSAEAAKSIQDLVNNAQEKTKDGKVITAKMIEGFNSLSKTIEETNTQIQEVAKNSTEQINAIEELNKAMSSIEKVAQKTKDIAQQTNEIASNTKQKSQQMLQDLDTKEF